MPSSTLIETMAVLDGRIVLDGLVEVRWGAVVVRLVREGAAVPATAARVLRLRAIADARDGLSFGGGPRILRDPRLFVALIASVAARGAYVNGLPLHAELVRAWRTPALEQRIPPNAWLRVVRERVHECFDRSINVHDLARMAGIHPIHLSRGFSAYYGMTMGRYAGDLRVMRAGELLLRTSQPLTEIALLTGFSDEASFSRAFSACLGVAPSELRRRVQARGAA
jgi:AraC family transcriptional regulator